MDTDGSNLFLKDSGIVPMFMSARSYDAYTENTVPIDLGCALALW